MKVGTMVRRNVRLLVVLAALTSLFAPASARGQGAARYALLIQGASGEEQYAVQHRAWLDGLAGMLRDRFGYDAAHLVVLAEQPRAGEARATADEVRNAMTRLAGAIKQPDQLVVVLIGHGTGSGDEAKFNLVGRDLTVEEWAALLKPIQGRLALVNTTSASFPYVAGLASPGRVIITATNSPAQKFHTVFPEGFVQAFSNEVADLDKNARVSLWEAFAYASRFVRQHYEQNGIMATEFPVLEDSGDGKGRDAASTDTSEDGSIAELTYLDGPALPTASDPETQRLLVRQRDLTEQMDDLRRRRPTMTDEEFNTAFEKLALELAEVSREVRKRTGK
jgi:hypothetical protein